MHFRTVYPDGTFTGIGKFSMSPCKVFIIVFSIMFYVDILNIDLNINSEYYIMYVYMRKHPSS